MNGEEWIHGRHAVAAVLASGRPVRELVLAAGRRDRAVAEMVARAESAGVAVRRTERAELDRLAGEGRHQGIAARVAAAEAMDEDEFREWLGERTAPMVLVLDEIQDPHNLGACLRSANAAGADAVVIPKRRAAGLTASARKVAAGAAEVTPVVEVTNLARTLKWLREDGFWLVGAAGEADAAIHDLDLTGRLALVLGGEEKGLRRLTREGCDFLARIPMRGTVESLNVSVAAGICLFEAVRQRNPGNP